LEFLSGRATVRGHFVFDPNVPNTGARQSTSTGLLRRVQAQEASAWERLVAVYAPLVVRWCRQAGLNEADADDVAQDVFASVFRHVGAFRRDQPGQSFRGWLRAVCRSRISDHWQNAGKGPRAEGGSDPVTRLGNVPAVAGDAAEAAGDEGEERLLLRQALRQLQPEFNPRDWEAFWRVVADGQSPDEVAVALGIRRHSVYAARSRILRRFREEFADLIGEGPYGLSP
jgi:RNA polymerase sigma-70 factor (ECF subfamily)